MSSFRCVLAAVCVLLLVSAPVALAQLTCTELLGVGITDQTFTTTDEGSTNLVYFVGAFQLPSTITSTSSFSSFQFTYTVPDQSGYTTPNTVSFAVYADDGTGNLIAESQIATINSGVTGDQTVTALILGSASALQPATSYRLGQLHAPLSHSPPPVCPSSMPWLTSPCYASCCGVVLVAAIWTAHPYLTYINSNPSQNTQYTVYNISEYGWPSSYVLLEAGPWAPFQFPLTYDGCVPAPVAYTELLGVSITDQSFTTAAQQSNNLVYFQGPYELPTGVTSSSQYNSFHFTYTVPDQTGYTTPNYLRFAIYNSDLTLVDESKEVKIKKHVTGDQTLTVTLQGSAGVLHKSNKYRLGQLLSPTTAAWRCLLCKATML